MSFLKKMGKVVSNTATKITETKNNLAQAYEKDSWVGLMDIAEKKIDDFNVVTNAYIDNLKTVNEKVIHETAKNSNSSFEAIWRSTFAVSKETFTFIGKDLKDQAVKMYKAWEEIEVERNFSPELNLLFLASSAINPEELMKYCGATRDGAIFTINNVQVEIYGEIWLDLTAPDKRFNGSLSLLQHIILHATEENLSDEVLLRNCLSIMYKLPEVKERYNALYAEYLANNPSITPLASPFDEREAEPVESSEDSATNEEKAQDKPLISPDLKASGAELFNKIKDGTSDYLQKGKELVSKYSKPKTEDVAQGSEQENVSEKPPVETTTSSIDLPDLAKIQKEVEKLEKLKAEIEAAKQEQEAVKVKPARKTTKAKDLGEVKAKPARKTATAKDVGEVKAKPTRKTTKAKDVSEK